jgi:acetyl esterase/lipase
VRRKPTPLNKILVEAIRKGPLFQWKEGSKTSLVQARFDFEQQMLKMPNELVENGEVHIMEEAAAPVPCEWVVPISCKDGDSSPVVIYLHGGGYIAGSPKSHRVLGSQLANSSDARVLLVDYPLAPKAAYPMAVEEVVRLYKWLLEVRSIDPTQIVFAGDSAGAGLVLQTLVHLQYGPLPPPACAVLMSPWVSLDSERLQEMESLHEHRDCDYLTLDLLESSRRAYLGEPLRDNWQRAFGKEEEAKTDADAESVIPVEMSPVLNIDQAFHHSKLALPPLLVQAGGSEMLLDDAYRVEAVCSEAGVEVELDVYEDMFHAFQLFSRFVKEGRQAIDHAGGFIKRHTTPAQPADSQ